LFEFSHELCLGQSTGTTIGGLCGGAVVATGAVSPPQDLLSFLSASLREAVLFLFQL
jgi:hypothetical protein